jgi:hypothetical protein
MHVLLALAFFADIAIPVQAPFVVVPPGAEVRASIDGPALPSDGHPTDRAGYFAARIVQAHRGGWLEVQTADPDGSCYGTSLAVRLFVRERDLAWVLARRFAIADITVQPGVAVLRDEGVWWFIGDEIVDWRHPPPLTRQYAPLPLPPPAKHVQVGDCMVSRRVNVIEGSDGSLAAIFGRDSALSDPYADGSTDPVALTWWDGAPAGVLRGAMSVERRAGRYIAHHWLGRRYLTFFVDPTRVVDVQAAMDEAVARHKKAQE